MSDDATPRLGLPYLATAQAQKHVTVNEGLGLLDALVQTAAQSRSLAAQPPTPAEGAIYVLPAAATGADWSPQPAGTVMRFEAGAWQAIAPSPGWIVLVQDIPEFAVFDGAAWTGLGGFLTAFDNLTRLGVNATADATNRFVVKSAAVLFDHVGAGTQLKLDKASAGDTGSLLLQTNYSGRAEIGLCGDDDLHIKVSADGSSFTEAMTVKAADGKVGLGVSAPTSRLHIDGCARVKSFAVAGLPSAGAEGAGAIAFVTDETGGATLAFSDGAAWRRVADRALVA